MRAIERLGVGGLEATNILGSLAWRRVRPARHAGKAGQVSFGSQIVGSGAEADAALIAAQSVLQPARHS